jgi:hypothetical protein
MTRDRPTRYLYPLRRDQVKALFYLKEETRRPMSDHLRDAVDRYLAGWGHAGLMGRGRERELRGR